MKKLLFALLAVALLVGAFGVTASAATEDFTTKTMNNFTATSTTTVDGNKCQYYFDGDLHLILEGTNTLNLDSNCGLYVTGHLTISGTGTLNISDSIYVGKNLTIESGTISAQYVTVEGGSYTMNGGSLTITGYSFSDGFTVPGELRVSNNDFIMNGGTLTASWCYANSALITGGTLNSNLDIFNSVEIQDGSVCTDIRTSNGSITISGGTVNFSSLETDNGLYISGGSVIAYRLRDYVSVSGGSLTVTNDFSIRSFSMSGGCVYSEPQLDALNSINISGGNLTAQNGLRSSNSSVTISDGTINIESTDVGIEAYENITISGGTVNVESAYYGLHARYGKINISTGNVSIYGSMQALETGSTISWNNNTCLTFYTGKDESNAQVATQYYSEKYVKTTDQHTWDSGYVYTSATHFKTGTYKYTCTVCSNTKSDTIPKLEAHVFSSFEQIDENTHMQKCECGHEEAASHSWDNGTITTAATHLATGLRTYTCTDCSAKKSETIPKIEEHTFDSWASADDNQHARKCECGHEEAVDHTWEEATCLRKKHCTVCQAEVGETDPKNHEKDAGSYTKTEDGYHQQKWKCCDTIAEKEKHIDEDKDHNCDVCDATISKHEAPDGEHVCPYCEKTVSKCKYDSDGYCRICGKNKEGLEEPADLTVLFVVLAFAVGIGIGVVTCIFLLPHLKNRKTKA